MIMDRDKKFNLATTKSYYDNMKRVTGLLWIQIAQERDRGNDLITTKINISQNIEQCMDG